MKIINKYAVLKNGDTIKLTYSERTVQNTCGGRVTTSVLYYVRDNKLYQSTSYHEENRYATHSWSDAPIFIGEVKYTYSDEDVEEAKFLLKMSKYFPNLKASRVTASVKELIKRLVKEEK